MNKKATLQITGMDCASCAAIIERGVKKEKGVSSANVNFATEKLYVDFNPDETNIDNFKKTIENLGYKATSDNAGEMEMSGDHDHYKVEKESEIKKLKLRFVFSLIFSLPVVYMVMGGLVGLPMPQIFETYGILIQAILSAAVICRHSIYGSLALKNFYVWRPIWTR